MKNLDFAALLELCEVPAKETCVLLHRTNEQPLRSFLPHISEHRPDLFEAYQSVHSRQAAATLLKRSFVASFVPLETDKMVFVALYKIAGRAEVRCRDIYSHPAYSELENAFGVYSTGPTKNLEREEFDWVFDLEKLPELNTLRGRLVIDAPPGRAYARLAENLNAPVSAILSTPASDKPPPDWSEMVIAARSLGSLPQRWSDRLRDWRGVYLIVDESDGARYVGSAYGQENLLGRWQTHVSGKMGVTKELAKRKTENFRFSILELVAPTAEPATVVAVENSWKRRLHTICHGLNQT